MQQLNQSHSKALDSVVANPSADTVDAIREIYCSTNPAEEKRAVLLLRQTLVEQVQSELIHQGHSV